MTVTLPPEGAAGAAGDSGGEEPRARRAPRDASAGPTSMQRLSTPPHAAPPPPSASTPLPRPAPPSPPLRPIGTPLPVKRARRRMPDEVRNSVVRTVLLLAFTLTGAMVVAVALAADSWFAAPTALVTLVLCVTSICSALEILVARQVHHEHLARGERCPFDP